MKNFLSKLLTIVVSIVSMLLCTQTFANNASMDLGFDTGIPIGFNDFVRTFLVQSDGKTIVGGHFSTYEGMPANMIVRLNADGTKDFSFASGGFSNDVITLASQSDGKLLVGGYFTTYQGAPQNYLIRLNADGTKDESFDIGSGFDSVVNSLAIQSDGKIIVGGNFTSYQGVASSHIIRLNTDGSKDTSW